MSKLSGKKILITSGGTREYIDDIRVVTNISSGALGAKIAESFYAAGCQVFFVHAKHSVQPIVMEGISDSSRIASFPVISAQDLHDTMKTLLTAFKIDAVIHSAAVSDFTFKHRGAVKLSSSSTKDFIEYMRQTITKTPKIISKVKKWSPKSVLVGFKFTVDKGEDELAQIAAKMGNKAGCDFVIANDKERMKEARNHLAIFVDYYGNIFARVAGKENIAHSLVDHLEDFL